MRLLSNSLAVLRVLAATTSGLTLQELASELDIPVASMHRLMTALCRESFVVRSPTSRRFFIGPDSVVVSSAAARSGRLHQVPPGPIAQAAFVSAQSVALIEEIDSRPVCVALAIGRRCPRGIVAVGDELPWYGSAGTRVMLIDHTDAELDHLTLLLDRHASGRPELARLGRRVELARERGYEIGDPAGDIDLNPDGWSVAVPVRGERGQITGAVVLLVTSARMIRQSVREAFVRTAVEAADRLRCPSVPLPTQERTAMPPPVRTLRRPNERARSSWGKATTSATASIS